jgi:hypothetical protein
MRLAWLLFCMAPLTAATLELSLKRAVQLAASPEGNTQMRLSAEALKQAESRSAQAHAALMPDINGAISEQNMTRNLAAVGIQIDTPIPGFQIPTLLVRSARWTHAFRPRRVFDLSTYRRFQASKVG